jgi:hypothetical protein
MGPVRSQSLVDLLTELTGLQSKTMTDSIFIGWTDESKTTYEERRKKIAELRAQLDQKAS